MASFSILLARAKAGDATAITKLLSMYIYITNVINWLSQSIKAYPRYLDEA